jgi:hypothetical protein
MTKQALESDADEFEPAQEPVKKPRKQQPTKSRIGTIMTLIAIIVGVVAAYEYRRAEQLNSDVSQAAARNSHLQQQLDTQTQELKSVSAKLQELARKNLPVSLIFRPSPSGNGLTTFFKNNAPSPVEIGVVLSNPATERRREVNLNLPANGLQSIGEADGWVFAPGHHILVTHAQFGTIDYVVPDKP